MGNHFQQIKRTEPSKQNIKSEIPNTYLSARRIILIKETLLYEKKNSNNCDAIRERLRQTFNPLG
jgi:hypothetical protein